MMRSLPARIQAQLARYYAIDDAPSVDDFIAEADDAREALLVRDLGDSVEIVLHLPRATIEPDGQPTFDELCQAVEGVSHFLYVAERARRELPTTQLELELQAEVDKYVLLAHEPREDRLDLDEHPRAWRLVPERAAMVRERLFDRVTYLHPEGTEPGDRYRIANQLAARYAGRLEARFARSGRLDELRAALLRFYRAGQTEKIALACAA